MGSDLLSLVGSDLLFINRSDILLLQRSDLRHLTVAFVCRVVYIISMIITYSSTLRNDDIWKPAASRQISKRKPVVNTRPINGMMADDTGSVYHGDSWY